MQMSTEDIDIVGEYDLLVERERREYDLKVREDRIERREKSIERKERIQNKLREKAILCCFKGGAVCCGGVGGCLVAAVLIPPLE